MSEEKKDTNPVEPRDSFGFPIKKNPWLIYALAHVPIVAIMVVILYVMYQSRPQ